MRLSISIFTDVEEVSEKFREVHKTHTQSYICLFFYSSFWIIDDSKPIFLLHDWARLFGLIFFGCDLFLFFGLYFDSSLVFPVPFSLPFAYFFFV